MTEYNRAAVIAHLSQPTATSQEGWGQPGTQFGGIYFRQRIRLMYTILCKWTSRTFLSRVPKSIDHCHTVESLDGLEAVEHPHQPGHRRDPRRPKDSLQHLYQHPALPPAAKPLLDVFTRQLELARYARSEPNLVEFENCMKVVALLLGM